MLILKETIVTIATCWALLLAAAILAWAASEIWWWAQFTWYHLGWILLIAGIIQLVRWWRRARFRRRLKHRPPVGFCSGGRFVAALPTIGTMHGSSYLIEALPKWRGFWIHAGGQSFWLKRGTTVVATVVHEKNKAGLEVVRYDFDQRPEALLRHRQQQRRRNAS